MLKTLDLELQVLKAQQEQEKIQEEIESKTMTEEDKRKFLKGLEEERFTIGKNLLGITDDMTKPLHRVVL